MSSMQKPIITMVSIVASSAAFGQAPPAPPPPPPVIHGQVSIVREAAPSTQKLITWASGSVLCDGVARQPVLLPPAAGSIGWVGSDNAPPKPVTIDFAIDADGRPHAIKRSSTAFSLFSDDLEPALATARFRPGTPGKQCQITYIATPADFESAPIDALIDYSIFPGRLRLPQAGYDHVKPAGADCFDPPPDVRARVYPDFHAIPQAPGTRSWSMIGFDIDARGQPTKVRVFRTTGNTALDQASLKAIAASRFEPGARRGCLYPYWRTAPPLAAPPMPANLPNEGSAGCPTASSWKAKPVQIFPEAYRRRGVEGWAVIQYDVAPWGATGNAQVLASEPSDAFGQAALNTVRSATKEASPQGYINCVTRVRFEIGNPKKPAAEPLEPPAPF